ncbi:MAG: cell wall hydrolase [Faecalicatena sp.]|uniref:cell wall hydrolase n=1 Tax=Faecalicatena sp. TaxID=2005360 RepID=UPI00258CDF3A|nr:cell wall hydrolase [Faecalicatena sp.]MCI6466038.1 cell wall hydrolase [Faecalicatena sp.]MDY5620032.1 cell wall hydrolase [Lachnospiraceae bacterium]
MKRFSKQKLNAGIALICLIALVCPPVLGQAKEFSSAQEKAANLQSELDGINKELASISEEIASIEMQTEMMSAEILRTEDSLSAAKKDEEKQYEDMKARIKYMYETGDATLLELLFSAENMTDFLNKAEFVQNVSDYDREMLDKLTEISNDIEAKEKTLKAQKKALSDLKKELGEQQKELEKKADETSTDLDALKAQMQREAAAAAGTVVMSTDGRIVRAGAMDVSGNEMQLLAAIIECEAYQDYNSLLAVATVIMNRVNDSRFPNTIAEVVYASNQFEPVTLGSLDAVLSRGPSDLSLQVAKDALNGARLAAVADCYFFLYAGATNKGGVNVGNNVFFQSW